MTRSNLISPFNNNNFSSFLQWCGNHQQQQKDFQHHNNATTDHGGVHFNDQVLCDVGRLVMRCAKAKARVPRSWWQSWLCWRSWRGSWQIWEWGNLVFCLFDFWTTWRKDPRHRPRSWEMMNTIWIFGRCFSKNFKYRASVWKKSPPRKI